MKRSELHEKVWSTPMTKLAKELGISDVGLAKACRRHSVPVPPRGYWAKVKAAQNPPRTPLPAPELDVDVHFATSDPEDRARQKAIERQHVEVLQARAALVLDRPPVPFAEDLEGAHPLVQATKKYCERIPKLIEKAKRAGIGAWSIGKPQDRPPPDQHGRYNLISQGCLDIHASLESMEWILRFHATLLRGLTEGGMTIVRREAVEERLCRRSNAPAVEMRFQGETLAFKFSEGYRRVRLTTSELTKKKRETSWAREYETRPSGKFTFSIEGTEYEARKAWQGTQEKLQGLVDEVTRTAFQLAALQPQFRKERETREASARREQELRILEQRRREARADQVKRAFAIMEADKRMRELNAFLERLEHSATEFRPPFDERLRVWIGVVRDELASRNPVDEALSECLSVPSWSTWPPAWLASGAQIGCCR